MIYTTTDTVPVVDVKRAFEASCFDYLPDVVPGCDYDSLSDSLLVTGMYPSDECIKSLPDSAIEGLAEENLRMLTTRHYWPTPSRLALFAAIGVRRGLSLSPDGQSSDMVGVRQAVVVPHKQIKGHITGPNRRMLDLVYEDLGVIGEPETETRTIDATQFGRLLIKPEEGIEFMGSPKRLQTHMRHRVSLRGSWRIRSAGVGNIFHRARLDEVETEYHTGARAGEIDTEVYINH